MRFDDIDSYLTIVFPGILVSLLLEALPSVVPFKPGDGIVAMLKGIAVAGILIEREGSVAAGIYIQRDGLVSLCAGIFHTSDVGMMLPALT